MSDPKHKLIDELTLETSRAIHTALNMTRLGQEEGGFPRLTEQVMRIHVRKEYADYFDRTVTTNPQIEKLFKEAGCDSKQIKKIHSVLRGTQGMVKSALKKDKEKFDPDKYVHDHKHAVETRIRNAL